MGVDYYYRCEKLLMCLCVFKINTVLCDIIDFTVLHLEHIIKTNFRSCIYVPICVHMILVSLVVSVRRDQERERSGSNDPTNCLSFALCPLPQCEDLSLSTWGSLELAVEIGNYILKTVISNHTHQD